MFVGVELTTDECKFIEVVNPEVILDKLGLDLPSWTPIPGCYDQSRFKFANFDWYKQFDLPFDILPNPEPKLTSCAVPFWFCGNSGNLPCDDQIDINIPIMNYDNSSSSSSSSSSESLQSEQSNSSESLSSNSSESNSSNSSDSSKSSESFSTKSSDSSQSVSTLSSNSSQSLSTQSSDSSQQLNCCDFSLYNGKTLSITVESWQNIWSPFDGSCVNYYSKHVYTGTMTSDFDDDGYCIYQRLENVSHVYGSIGEPTTCPSDCYDYRTPVITTEEDTETVYWKCCNASDYGGVGKVYFPSVGSLGEPPIAAFLAGSYCGPDTCYLSSPGSDRTETIQCTLDSTCFSMDAVAMCCLHKYESTDCTPPIYITDPYSVYRLEWHVTIT